MKVLSQEEIAVVDGGGLQGEIIYGAGMGAFGGAGTGAFLGSFAGPAGPARRSEVPEAGPRPA